MTSPCRRLAGSLLLAAAAAGAIATAAPAADFRTTANAACVRYDRTTNALPQIASAAELKRRLVLVPKLFTTMVDRIAALDPPHADAARAGRLVASLRQVERAMNRIRDAFLRGDQAGVDAAVRAGTPPSRVAARTAQALGLPACVRIAAQAAKGSQP